MLLENSPLTAEIYDLLYRLGVSAESVAFFHTAYAVRLAVEQPQMLLLVTKWLYPEVARHYHTNWKAVERNIRRVVAAAWKHDPGAFMRSRPGPASRQAGAGAVFVHTGGVFHRRLRRVTSRF